MDIAGCRLSQRIYQSRSSTVYRALREEDGLPVVLKVLNKEYPSPEEILRYKQEYEITRRLHDLPGVIGVYGIRNHGNTLVMILEDFGADSLASLAALGQPTVAETLELAIHIVHSLDQIHAAHTVHKDINPSNIVYNPLSKKLKVVDFGISTVLAQEEAPFADAEKMEGTLPFISPEQTGRINRSVDYRSDYYSLGVTLYQLLTGRLPFDTVDPLEMVHCHIAKSAEPPNALDPAIPDMVSAIVMKLMAKDPEDRYQSAWGIATDLERCLSETRDQGGIRHFRLGFRDVPQTLRIPQKMYGRDEDTAKLIQALDSTQQGKREIVLVAGSPGIGKTLLVKEICKQVALKNGHFISGKFDQFRKSKPYSAVITALSDLMRQFLGRSEVDLSTWRRKLQTALAPHGQIMIDMIPELELIIGPQPSVPELGPIEERNRFGFVVQNFMRCIAQPDYPLVLFLDDLQWADNASLQMLKLIAQDPQAPCILLIGAYRDTEVSPGHPLNLMVQDLESHDPTVRNISLGPLLLHDVVSFCADTLHTSRESVTSLAELLYQRTGGNPFHIIELIKSLHVEGLLRFDRQTGGWLWNLDEIRSRRISDSLADLMAERLQRLPQDTQEALKMGSCIGSRFDLELLSTALGRSPRDVVDCLTSALSDGVILPLGDSWKWVYHGVSAEAARHRAEFRFCHDRVQEASYSLIAVEDRNTRHLLLGQILLQSFSREDPEGHVFTVVNQMNLAHHLITDEAGKNELARLNLVAGKKAISAAAYQSAFDYLMTGIPLLRPSGWEKAYELNLDLHSEATSAAYLSGHPQDMDELIAAIFNNARCTLDRARAYEVRILSQSTHGNAQEAIETARTILAELGYNIPRKATKLRILSAMARCRLAMRRTPPEALSDQQPMTDPTMMAISRIIAGVVYAAFISDRMMYVLLVLERLYIFVKYGRTPGFSANLASYGMILMGMSGNPEMADRFGKLATRMAEQYDEQYQGRVKGILAFFIRPMTAALSEAPKELLEAYRLCVETGEFVFGSLSAVNSSVCEFYSGCELPVVDRHIAVLYPEIKKLHQENSIYMYSVLTQMVWNFMGKSADPCRMVGDAFDEDAMLPLCRQSGNAMGRAIVYLSRLVLTCFFRKFRDAVYCTTEMEPVLDNISMTPLAWLFHFYESLALLGHFTDADKATRRQYLKRITSNLKRFRKLAEYAPMNQLHRYYLVEAERLRVLGRHDSARPCYEEAIRLAREHKWLHEEALAFEWAAHFYLALGQRELGRFYLLNARYGYQRWGAAAKVKAIEAEHSQLLGMSMSCLGSHVGTETSLTATWSRRDLDLITVTKASQAISDEIMLDRLVDSLLGILLEHAGAQRGYLIMVGSDGGLRITAKKELEGLTSALPDSDLNHHTTEIWAAIVKYVARTKELFVLNNPEELPQLADVTELMTNEPKSVLCAPLIRQGKLVAVLYLENNLTTNAFNPDRVEVSTLLCSQAAISLENARLYEQRARMEQNLVTELNKFHVLYDLAVAMTSDQQMDEKLALVVEKSRELLKTDTSFIALSGDSGTDMVIKAVSGVRMSEFRNMTFPSEAGLGGRTPVTSQARIIEDFSQEMEPVLSDVGRTEDLRSGIAVPIHSGRQTLGSLYVADRKRTSFSQSDVDSLSLVGKLVAVETERTRGEELLRQSEERYRSVMHAAADPIVVYDMEGRVSYLNPSFTRVFGWTLEEQEGRRIDFVPAEKIAETLETIERMKRGQTVSGLETARRTKEGRIIDIQLSCSPFKGKNDELVGSVVILRDITFRKRAEEDLRRARDELEQRVAERTVDLAAANIALKENEQRLRILYEESTRREELYRSLLNSSPDAVVIYDMEGRAQYVNPSFTEKFGWALEDVYGKRIDFVPDSEKEATAKLVGRLIDPGDSVAGWETKRCTRDGKLLDISLSSSRYNDHEGKPAGILVILRDITQRKLAEKELHDALETMKLLSAEAEAANMAKSAFVANMSHEIRTPMNAVIGLTDLALRSQVTPKIRDYLTKIRISSHSLLGIINDILDFSKIEAGKLELEIVDFDLRSVVENLADLLANEATKRDVEFLLSIGAEVPRALRGDPLRLGQVLTNLASNAVKFTHQGEIVIGVTVVHRNLDRVKLSFSVKDSGIGIPEHKIPSLFQAFTQADESTTRKYGGSGLGLSICKRLVEMMGGNLTATSQPGLGSEFSFSADFVLGDPHVETEFEPPPDMVGLNVLVVDDNKVSQTILLDILRGFSFNAKAVDSGEDALQELVSREDGTPYDLILMDWRMPGMDGIQAARIMDEHPRLKGRVPKIIMITAYGREEVMARAKAAGFDGFLVKPAHQAVLFDTIMEVFGKDTERHAAVPGAADAEEACLDRIRGARILLVEDNAINQQVAREILERAGIAVRIASDGKQAIRAVVEDDFDAVLMDIQMPEMDGYETSRAIRADPSLGNVPIIAMTAHAMIGDREKCLEAGMNDHVTKPIGIRELFSTLAKWLRPASQPCVGLQDNGKPSSAPDTWNFSFAPDRIDMQYAMELLGGDIALFRKLLRQFLPQVRESVLRVRTAWENADFALARRMAHSIRGVSGNLGAKQLSEAAGNLEDAILSRDEGAFGRCIDDFEGAAAFFVEAVETVLREARRPVELDQSAAPAESRDLDVAELIPSLVELGDLIDRHDLSAVDRLAQIREDHPGAQFNALLDELAARLDAFDFRTAKEILTGVVQGHEPGHSRGKP